MANRLLFPDYVVCDFLVGVCCKKCGESDQYWTLLPPLVTLEGAQVEVIFPIRCPCGGSGSVSRRMPLLQFGYVVGKVAIMDAQRAYRRSKATMQIRAHRSELLSTLHCQYTELICEIGPNILLEPSETDRIKFGLAEEEWTDFLKRLLGNDEDCQ